MEGHRPKELLDQVRAYPELGEGTPSASNTIPIARSRPTAAGSNATSLSAAYVTRPKPTSRGRGVPHLGLAHSRWDQSRRQHQAMCTGLCIAYTTLNKMLYDESQLARVYLHAWQVTGNEFFRTITEEILDYVIREMTDPSGGSYSTQDADSEGVEGKFFVWTMDEIPDAGCFRRSCPNPGM
jgi:hypothetical protein